MISAALLACALAAPASARAHTYLGAHPIDLDGHWDEDGAAHEHGELIVGAAPFGEVEGVRIFLADPIAWGWDREVWTFRGAHPLPADLPGYCGVAGEHRHVFAPEGSSYRRDPNGVHIYRGGMRGGLAMVQPDAIAPPTPIVPPPAYAAPAPYLFSGCLHRLVLLPSGARMPTALPGCTPLVLRRRGSRGRSSAQARAGSTYFDGNYTGFQTPPARVAPRPVRTSPRQ